VFSTSEHKQSKLLRYHERSLDLNRIFWLLGVKTTPPLLSFHPSPYFQSSCYILHIVPWIIGGFTICIIPPLKIRYRYLHHTPSLASPLTYPSIFIYIYLSHIIHYPPRSNIFFSHNSSMMILYNKNTCSGKECLFYFLSLLLEIVRLFQLIDEKIWSIIWYTMIPYSHYIAIESTNAPQPQPKNPNCG